MRLSAMALLIALGLMSPVHAEPASPASAQTTQRANPLFTESSLPLHYPPFDLIDDSDFAPAFDAGMTKQLQEIEAIASNPEPASFDNTIIALERSGALLQRARTIFSNLTSADTNEVRKRLQAEYAPQFALHQDAIWLNERLFARIAALYDERDRADLDPESERLLEKYYADFLRAGARLSPADKIRLKDINEELAALSTRFNQNVLNEVNASAVVFDHADDLAGASPAQIATAAEAARSRSLGGRYAITLLNTTSQPPLSYLSDRRTRQQIFEASIARGSRGDLSHHRAAGHSENEHDRYDNREIISQVMTLRARRARLLGYPNHAAYVLEQAVAQTPEAVNTLLRRLAPPAMANAEREAAELQRMIDQEQAVAGEPSFQLEPWDWAYYTEKVRRAKFGFEEARLKPYLELTQVLENGVFHAAHRLYGLTFQRRTDLPVYHDDVWVYDVFDADGSQLAIFIADMYARPSKRGGAWASAYVVQSGLHGHKPVIANHLNLSKPPAGEPTLLTWDEVNTAFHEFGHALHGMLSNVKYPYFSGTRVPRDFVEYPSQINEMWASWPSILQNYAKHYQSGEPIPPALLDKVIASEKFNQGFATVEYLGSAMLDQRWHRLEADQVPDAAGILVFEAHALNADGIYSRLIPPRYRTPYFSHIMSGYAASYYAYLWAEVLDANSEAWFRQRGGPTRANGDHFRATVLARGGSVDAMQLFQDFTGHAPRIEPLLERRGLETASP